MHWLPPPATDQPTGPSLGDTPAERWLAAGVLLAMILPTVSVVFGLQRTSAAYFEKRKPDTWWVYQEGLVVADGRNPYSRIHTSDMRQNDKYPTYLPATYLTFAAAHHLGADNWAAQYRLWRTVVLLGTAGIAFAMFMLCRPRIGFIGAAAAVGLILYSRYGLYCLLYVREDLPAIALLLGSLVLWRRGLPVAAALALGISISVKHFGIFLAPLYVYWAATSLTACKPDWRLAARVTAAGASVPLILSLPFLIDDPMGLIKSIAFSMTRVEASNPMSLVELVRLEGWPARLPMMALMLVWLVVGTRMSHSPAAITLLLMLVFILFNQVFFKQYMFWGLALVPPALAEFGYSPVPRDTNGAADHRPS